MDILKSLLRAQLGLQILLLFTLFIETCTRVPSNSQILYVVASNGSQCPPEIATSHCQTLDWYIQNKDVSFKSNTRMIFLEGKHVLDNFIEISSCYNFTMTASKSALPYSDSLPQPASWIFCNRESRSGIFFVNSSEIHITSLGLDSCSGVITLSHISTVYVALAFVQVNHITLSQVVINNTRGFGLYCFSVFGKISMNESVFMNAKGSSSPKIYGGNAQFWFDSPCYYGNSDLIINHSWFMYGENTADKFCNASGLQILIDCSKIHVRLNNVMVNGNRGINGGNLGLSLTEFGTDDSTVTISNCNISNGWATKGGGIRVWSQVVPNDSVKNVSVLTISSSNFYNNIANTSAGGAVYITHYDANNYLSIRSKQIHISDCMFSGNKGAIEMMKLSIPGYMSSQFAAYFHRCKFHSNQVPSDKITSIVELIRIENITVADCTFTDSSGSVIYLQNSYLHFFGIIRFENNHAAYGGALKVCDSSLIYLHNATDVLFINNSARMGGAVYSLDGCVDTVPPCLFQPVSSSVKKVHEGIRVKFVNNSATLAGDAIYGGSIDYCYALFTLSYDGTYTRPLNDTLNLLDMSEQSGSSIISSDPHGVCFSDEDTVTVCKQFTSNFSTFPGKNFNINATIIGQLNGTTVGEINAFLVDDNDIYNNLVSVSSHRKRNGQSFSLVTYKVHSNQTEVKLNLSAIIPTFTTCFNPIDASMNVTLLPCPFGFALTDTPPYLCDCSPLFHEHYAQCNIDTQLIQIHVLAHNPVWFGCDHQKSDNNTVCNLSRANKCYYYCNQNDHYVNITNYTVFDDQQCLSGLTGILCGACKPGLSRVLGSLTKCQKCSNKNLSFLIPLFFLSGWLIIMLLTALNMTVAEGTINGLVIYANAIYAYQKIIPHPHSIFKRICWTFIALLNFDVGFEMCYYDGMDSYQKLWILYGYTFYLITLQITIVLLCRRFVMCTRLFRKNVVQVLATLLFLMYAPIIEALVNTFARSILTVFNINNTELEKRSVCIFDGNVTYLGAKHSPLFVIALVYSIGLTLFTLSLLFNQCLQRRSNLFCFQWVERWRPFFEAYTGPCNNNFRFWPGFLMFMRVVLVVIINNRPTSKMIPPDIITFSVVIMSLSYIFPHGMYKKWSLNVLEFSFFLNLCITSILWMAIHKIYHEPVFYLSVSVGMFIFLGIILYHIKMRIGIKIPICQRIKLESRLPKLSNKILCKHQIELCCCNETEGNDETAPLLSQPLASCVQSEPLP